MSGTLRLDRLLSNLGYGSRREVHGMVARGRVELDGEALRKPDLKLLIEEGLRARLTVDGEALDLLPGLTLIMHKPPGYTCSHKEDGSLVYELLPERWRKREPALSTAGRLDKETSGLLLLSDDGPLLHRIAAPKRALPKRYRAQLARPLRGDEKELFASGSLTLEGEKTPLLPARLQVHGDKEATLEIREGRYHQVRRMFAAAGNHVVALHREAIGALPIPADLPEGTFRPIRPEELRAVFEAAEA